MLTFGKAGHGKIDSWLLDQPQRGAPLSQRLATIALVSAMSVSAALAQQTGATLPQSTYAGTCSNKILSGNYSYLVIGQAFADAPYKPLVSERLITFDGNGNLSGTGYFVAAGTSGVTAVTGTYTVNPDCSMTANLTVLKADGSIADKNQLFGVVTAIGVKVHGVITAAIDTGTYSFEFEKTLPGFPFPEH